MNRGTLVLFLSLILWASNFAVLAQGTLLLSNFIGGVAAPVSGVDGILGAGYSAELATKHGVRITGPTPFLANGLFLGGVIEVPGIPPGEALEVSLVISDSNGEIIGISGDFEVVLGGAGVPPSLPGGLNGLWPFHADGLPYSWNYDYFPRVCEKNTPVTIVEIVDDSICIAMEERLSRLETNSMYLMYTFGSDGELEIKWPAGSPAFLFGSRLPGVLEGKRITGDVYRDGYRVLSLSPSEPQMFYWLAVPNMTTN